MGRLFVNGFINHVRRETFADDLRTENICKFEGLHKRDFYRSRMYVGLVAHDYGSFIVCVTSVCTHFFKVQVCWLEAVHTSMLADVSQVELASINSMLLILFVCIFNKPVHIVPFLYGFFASYIKEGHV
jgi:hypothetical protein